LKAGGVKSEMSLFFKQCSGFSRNTKQACGKNAPRHPKRVSTVQSDCEKITQPAFCAKFH
jgi:hypothetical protein